MGALNARFPITISIQVRCDGVFVVIFFKTMYNKKIIRFCFCDILNNEGLSKCYQPRPSARLITPTSTLIIPDITKNESNNCFISAKWTRQPWHIPFKYLYAVPKGRLTNKPDFALTMIILITNKLYPPFNQSKNVSQTIEFP